MIVRHDARPLGELPLLSDVQTPDIHNGGGNYDHMIVQSIQLSW
jgi:hypothetical protein